MTSVIDRAMTLAMGVVMTWYLTLGHDGMMRKIRQFQVSVLHEIGRTSNWGNPNLPFESETRAHRHDPKQHR